jgi:uncharacterized protein YjbJ (UPF0337 family)
MTDDPAEIREEIEHTRSEMSGTIDAIQERLSPDHLKEQAMGAVRDATIGRAQTMVDDVTYTAREKGATTWETIRANPIPAAMAAIGIGLLWKNRSHGSMQTRFTGQDMYNYGYAQDYSTSRTSVPYSAYDRTSYDRYGYTDAGRGQRYDQDTGGVQERVGEMAGTVQEKAGQAVDHVSHLGSQAAHLGSQVGNQAAHLGSQAADLGSHAVDRVTHLPSEGMYAVRNRYDQMIVESPLALGLIALGVGAAVGLVVPETERENQLMGGAKDQLVDRAGEKAQETLGKVQQVASQAGDAVQQVVQEQTSTP